MKDMAATPDTMHAGGTMPKLQQNSFRGLFRAIILQCLESHLCALQA